MKITVESTPGIYEKNGSLGRIWAGTDDNGVPIVAYIWAVSPLTHDQLVGERFAEELNELLPPDDQVKHLGSNN